SDFVSKDHSFYSGEQIEKSGILINDSPEEVTVRVNWTLKDSQGKPLLSKKGDLTVPQGETGFLPITFQTPEIQGKTEYVLEASWVDPAGKSHQAEPLSFRVFPREKFSWPGKKVGLIEAGLATKKILQDLKIPVVTLEEGSKVNASVLNSLQLLIIGRQSYPLATKLVEAEAIMEAVNNGLNILILEQLNRHILGLKLENTNSREVFIRAKDSPLFAGLDSQDLAWWRGESHLLPSYPSFDPESLWWYASYSYQGQMNAWRQRRAWHWSNKGTVATFSYEKPQQGNFRVLTEAGFDLLYTPLIELSLGQGRILLSQLDLTDHYGKDPVATLLFQRILKEYSSPKKETKTPVGTISQESAALLEGFGFQARLGISGRVVFLSPRDLEKLTSQQAIVLKDFLNKGRYLLTSCTSQEQAGNLPVEVKFEKREVFNPDLPDHPVFSGVGRSDVFLRQFHQFQAITGGKNGKISLCASGLAAVCQAGKGLVVILQVPPGQGKSVPDGWSRPKVRRLYATVLSNLGAISLVKPDWLAIGGWGQIEEWLPGYAERVAKKAPKVKESHFYPEEGLDWDPDAHVAF
ncbi:MAG: hypothetical protein NC911_10525, partial [Candidatus Omnitrophica bacterium]|nr:hypothetical protein [Candidatus Omnitrophota bacterium]